MTYDYRCSCGYEVTIVAKITDTVTPPICVACREVMKKDYTPPAVTFNGSGFYSTDK
jgi:predicted nucleic acid-binding Zn ribbon protein